MRILKVAENYLEIREKTLINNNLRDRGTVLSTYCLLLDIFNIIPILLKVHFRTCVNNFVFSLQRFV